jgi:hypothetical protein
MKASDFDTVHITCNVCREEFKSWKGLAGHILAKKDHPDKRWAVNLLFNEGTISRNDFMWR